MLVQRFMKKSPTAAKRSFDKYREISVLNRIAITPPRDSSGTHMQTDLNHCIQLVQKYDPSGYLPGLLLPSNEGRVGYFATRAFWISSGLRYREHPLSNTIAKSKQIAGIGEQGILVPDDERIQMWKNGMHSIYDDEIGGSTAAWQNNSVLRLLNHVIREHNLSQRYFDNILFGREKDVDMKQYPTVKSLEDHALLSCGSLLNLALECMGIYQGEDHDENSIIFETAKHIGLTHGLANALRQSVPTAAATGKVIVPQELCDKYSIKSARYLLSALSMGDTTCKIHLQSAVKDIAMIARGHLETAREMSDSLQKHEKGSLAAATFLPALASETFLDRLEDHHFDLTDRSLRSVGFIEHSKCASRLVLGSIKTKY